uniref:Uncharacterized protein n=1 Tax=Gossypium raimondii TaxID=29730 RepID=A0A0D2MQ47_GOSRA|nr:hypothetical protein B456_003G172000 [Gossypium raimondii]
MVTVKFIKLCYFQDMIRQTYYHMYNATSACYFNISLITNSFNGLTTMVYINARILKFEKYRNLELSKYIIWTKSKIVHII